MQIRVVTESDAKAISSLIQKSTEQNPNHYSTAQQKVWIEYNSVDRVKEFLVDRLVLCAVSSGEIVGTIALKEDEILGFYIDVNRRGKGIGTKLLTQIETVALENNIKVVRLTSTPSAIDFYLKNGFKAIEKVVVTINGVDYPETAMEKEL